MPQTEVTPLTPAEENKFKQWIRVNNIPDLDHPDSHYDYRGYWKEYGNRDIKFGEDHFPDTYKQHGHPTFSVESKYSQGLNDGGQWDGERYIPQMRTPSNPNYLQGLIPPGAELKRGPLSPPEGADAAGLIRPRTTADTVQEIQDLVGPFISQLFGGNYEEGLDRKRKGLMLGQMPDPSLLKGNILKNETAALKNKMLSAQEKWAKREIPWEKYQDAKIEFERANVAHEASKKALTNIEHVVNPEKIIQAVPGWKPGLVKEVPQIARGDFKSGGYFIDKEGKILHLQGVTHDKALLESGMVGKRREGYSDTASALRDNRLVRIRHMPDETGVEAAEDLADPQFKQLLNFLTTLSPTSKIGLTLWKRGKGALVDRVMKVPEAINILLEHHF